MNNLKELHALFTFATSGKILGTHKDFQNDFGKPIEAARSADADDFEVKRGEEARQELQQLIQPYFLQRMKSDYLSESLPPKNEYVLWTNLSPLQREKYTEFIQSEYVSGLLEGEAKSPLFAITWLQKLCGHPLLVEGESVDSIENFDEHDTNELMNASTKLDESVDSIDNFDGHDPNELMKASAKLEGPINSMGKFDEHDPNDLMEASAKLEVMYNLVNTLISKGHRTLIFSQSTKVLNIIERVLKERFKILRIDGKTKEKDRQKHVDQFNEPESDVDIMLISTKAGGQGLTLTGADSCVVYDPSWNPAEDAQAVGEFRRVLTLGELFFVYF